MSVYDHLNSYPYLKQFCEEEQISLSTYTRTHQQLTLQEIIQTNLPKGIQDDFDKRRFILDRCLGFAYRHGLMNPNRKNRLKARDQNFWSTFGELRVGHWLEHLGLTFKEFNPPAKGRRKGDYLVSTNLGNDMFIEVKVFSGDKEYCSRSDLLSSIADLTIKIRPDINEITIDRYKFIDGRDRKVFLNNVQRFLETACLPGVFSDQGIFGIEIAFNIRRGVPFSIGWAGFVAIDDKLADLLHGAQLSKTPIPSVVFIYDLGLWGADSIENVLYGNRVTDEVNDKNYRKKDGIWNINHPSPLNAVGILRFSLDNPLPSAVTIYLAPEAKYPITLDACFSSTAKYIALASNHYDLSVLNVDSI
jgi:hypothetical protein